jgi:hypothetical protein
LVLELEGLRVADAQVDVAPGLLSALAGDLQHLWAELDCGQVDVGGVVGQVALGPEGDLEDLAAGLCAGPFAAAGEEDPVEEPHLAVVAGHLVVLDAADALGLGHNCSVARGSHPRRRSSARP